MTVGSRVSVEPKFPFPDGETFDERCYGTVVRLMNDCARVKWDMDGSTLVRLGCKHGVNYEKCLSVFSPFLL